MELLRLSKAAELLGITRQAMNAAVREGRIKSREIAGVVVVTRAAVDAYEVDRDRQRRGLMNQTNGVKR
jgi:hypothetical protein